MARYELSDPAGRRYEITAPDDASQDEVLARFKQHVSSIDPYHDEVNAEAERRQREGGPEAIGRGGVIADTAMLSAMPQATAAARVGIERLIGGGKEGESFADAYGRERDVIRRQVELKRQEMGAGEALPTDIATGMAMTAPRAVAAAAGQAVPYLKRIWDSARAGAGFAGVSSFNRETGDFGDKFAAAGEGAIGGAVVGAAVPPALSAAGTVARGMRRAVTRSVGPRQARQAQFAEDYRAATGDEPPGAIVAESPTLQRTGRGLAGNITGGPIREDVRPAIETTERRIREAIGEGTGAPGRAEFGERSQGFLRDKLLRSSRSSAELDAMTPEELAQTGIYRPSSKQESYPTQFGAKYRSAEQTPVPGYGTAADVRGNFVDNVTPIGRGGPTATWRLLNQLGEEARAAGRLKGWQSGDLNDPRFWDTMRRQFGDEIAGLLQSEHARRAANQANLTIPGLRDMRTLVRRTLQDTESTNPAAQKVGSIAALKRLHASMTDDMQRFLNASGGSNAALGYTLLDKQYQRFVEDIRQPLRRLFGDNVSPDEAFNRLHKAILNGSTDTRMLAAFYRTIYEKGNITQAREATRALLSPFAREGLPGFIEGMKKLAPEARAIMERHYGSELLTNLDRLQRVADRLEPYRKAMEGGRFGIDLSRPSNIVLGLSLLHNIPATIMAAGGANLLARFMTSPRYVRWLTELPAASRGGSMSPAFQRHIARLSAIAADDKEIGKEVLQAVGDVLRPDKAQAAQSSGVSIDQNAQLTPQEQVQVAQDEAQAAQAPAPATGRRQADMRATPEQRSFLLPLKVPKGGYTSEPGTLERFKEGLAIPGIINQPLEAWQRAQEKAAAGASPGELVPDVTQAALGAGAGAAITALPGGIERSALGTFIGRVGAEGLAKAGRPTALKVLNFAEHREATGWSPERIQDAARQIIERNDPRLGSVRKGADGEWRIEIDDSGSRFDPNAGTGRLGGALQHEELYTAYPEMRNIDLQQPERSGGYHMPGVARYGVPSEIGVGRGSPDPRRTALHETQHEAQLIEGFGRGGSPADFEKGGPLAHLRQPGESAKEAYQRIAGEVEAEKTANRRDLTPAERRDIGPEFSSPNIPPDRQIVRYGGEGISESSGGRSAKWSDEMNATLAKMVEDGATMKQIGAAMGLNPSVVWKQANMMGLTLRDQASQMRKRWADPEYRATVGARTSERMKKLNADPEFAAARDQRIKDLHANPEFAAAHRERMRERMTALNERRAAEMPAGRGRAPQTRLDAAALSHEQKIRNLEDKLRAGGRSDDAIAQAINAKFGTAVTAEDIAGGNVWWRVGEGADTDWSHHAVRLDAPIGETQATGHQRIAESDPAWHLSGERAEPIEPVIKFVEPKKPTFEIIGRVSDAPPAKPAPAQKILNSSARIEIATEVRELWMRGVSNARIIAAIKKRYGYDLTPEEIRPMTLNRWEAKPNFSAGIPLPASSQDQPHYSNRQPRDDAGRFNGPPRKPRRAPSRVPSSDLARIGLEQGRPLQ